MDLFVVNRFWGDGNQELNHSLKERNQINNLLKKIEARKKQKHRENASESGKDAVLVEDPTHETETSDTQVISEEQGTENNLANFDDGDINYNFKCENETTVTETLGLEGNSGENLINEISANAEATKDFTIIGSDSVKSSIKATHKLPSWLENPVTIPVDLSKKKNLKKGFLLDQKLIKKLKENKIKYFFPVQEKVIPWLLKSNSRCLYHWPRDICVSAPTGSGKTLAFVLPIIQALMGRLIPEIRALVVLPVAELAKQVGAVFHQYCSGTGLKVTVAVGGGTPFFKEHSLLVKTNDLVGCQTDILVTTPGRLVAHLRADSGHSLAESTSHHSPSISLGYLQFLVVDEADRVAEGSQNDWLSHLMHHMERQLGLASSLLPPSVSTIRKYHRHPHRPPQKLLFSATLSKDPEKLRSLFLFQPKLFSTPQREDDETREERAVVPTTYTTPKELSEEYIIAGDGESGKPLVLLWLLQQRLQGESSAPKALVFTNSRRSSSRLALLLSHMPWDETAAKPSHLSADLPLRDRETILRHFLENRINVLVCSDALARGIDIPQVDLVISYDPPRHMTNHIHRIGRTGRAGRHGCAITILTPNQLSPFSNMVSGGSSMGNAKEVTACLKSLNSLRDKYQNALAAMERDVEEERIKWMKNKRKMNDDNRKPSAMKTNFKRMKSNVNCQQ